MSTEGCAAKSGVPHPGHTDPREPELKGWSPGTRALSPSPVGSSIQLVQRPLPVHGSPWAELRAGFSRLSEEERAPLQREGIGKARNLSGLWESGRNLGCGLGLV